MTPTPRTDEVWLAEYPHDQDCDARLERVLSFARTLERELAEAKRIAIEATLETRQYFEQNDALNLGLAEATAGIHRHNEQLNDCRNQLTAMTRERDGLAALVGELLSGIKFLGDNAGEVVDTELGRISCSAGWAKEQCFALLAMASALCLTPAGAMKKNKEGKL